MPVGPMLASMICDMRRSVSSFSGPHFPTPKSCGLPGTSPMPCSSGTPACVGRNSRANFGSHTSINTGRRPRVCFFVGGLGLSVRSRTFDSSALMVCCAWICSRKYSIKSTSRNTQARPILAPGSCPVFASRLTVSEWTFKNLAVSSRFKVFTRFVY